MRIESLQRSPQFSPSAAHEKHVRMRRIVRQPFKYSRRRHGVTPPMARRTPIRIPLHPRKLVVSHADNHLFYLAIVSDRFLCAWGGRPVAYCHWISSAAAFGIRAIGFCPPAFWSVSGVGRGFSQSLSLIDFVSAFHSSSLWV
jgi:hypothetical protein